MGNKKPVPWEDGPFAIRLGSDGLRQLHLVQINGVRMVPLVLELTGATAKQTVEFVDEQVDGLVAVISVDACIHVRATDFNMALGREAFTGNLLGVTFELHPYAHDTFLVSKQSLDLLLNERLHSRGKFKMNARDDHFVRWMGVVHGFFCLIQATRPESALAKT